MNKLISIIIPCYNQARFLPDAINSLITQTYTNWECIIVNDGSTDNTREVSLNFSHHDSRIFYIEQHNQGLSAARNTGLKRASGDYIQFLDSDDVILKDKLSTQLAGMKNQDGLSVSICRYYFGTHDDIYKRANKDFDTHTNFNLDRPLQELISRWEGTLSIPVHCFLFDAKIFRNHNIKFNTMLKNHEDWCCWLDIFMYNQQYFS